MTSTSWVDHVTRTRTLSYVTYSIGSWWWNQRSILLPKTTTHNTKKNYKLQFELQLQLQYCILTAVNCISVSLLLLMYVYNNNLDSMK